MNMRKPARVLLSALAIAAAAGSLEAQGFKPFELGARAATLGGAFAGRADDVSAIFYNPAGLGFQPGLRLKIDQSYNIVTTRAEGPGSGTSLQSDSARYAGNPYVAFSVKGVVSFGVGVFSANRMKASWPNNRLGVGYKDLSSVDATYLRPVLAVKIARHFALGAGVDFVLARQAWNYEKTFTFEETSAGYVFPFRGRTNVEGRGIGFVAGWLFKPSDRFGIGGKYTSRIRIDLKGTTDFDSEISRMTALRGLTTGAKMALPEEVVVGIMVSPFKGLALHADYQRIGMAGAMDWMFDVDARVYDDLERVVGFRPDESEFGAGLVLRNTDRIMFGVEYLFRNALGVRAGYSRQGSSVDDEGLQPVFPDLETDILSFGLGYEGPFFDFVDRDKKIGGLSVDASVQYGDSRGRTSRNRDFPAFFKGSRWSFGVGVGFVF